MTTREGRQRAPDALERPAWRPLRWLLFAGLLVYAAALFTHEIYLVDADLGRHLKNGELFFDSGRVEQSNLYSYTEPDREVINHHWGSGVLFYGIWIVSGFAGLSIFYALLHVAVVALLIRSAARESGPSAVLCCTVACLPLLAFRPEIRPESLSYLFVASFYALLWGPITGAMSRRWLALLPALQVVWTNVHLFFCFGPLLAGASVLDVALRRQRDALPVYLGVALGVSLACLVNPFGLAGALEPFTILREYGYPVAENQSVWELQRSYDLPVLIHFELLAALAAMLFLRVLMLPTARRALLARFLLLLLLGGIAFRIGRAVALFGLLAIPIGSAGLQAILQGSTPRRRRVALQAMAGLGAILLLAPVALPNSYLSPFSRSLGIGLAHDVQRSAQFFTENRIEGPIFNDYDIGGYLIFHLYPRERVFVDNRPEAYSVPFFREVYIPMQQDEAVWRRMEQRYGFNAIYFSRRDRTPWAREFLLRRLRDPSWAPVHADGHALILLKRNARNRELIARFEPRS